MRSLPEIQEAFQNNEIRTLKSAEYAKSNKEEGILPVCLLAAEDPQKLRQVAFHNLGEKSFKRLNKNGHNIIGEACTRGYAHIIIWETLTKNAWGQTDKFKKNALHYAVQYGQTRRIFWGDNHWVKKGLTQQDREGKTPLDYMSLSERESLPEMYGGKNPLPEIKCQDGQISVKKMNRWELCLPFNKPAITSEISITKPEDWPLDFIRDLLHLSTPNGATLLHRIIKKREYTKSYKPEAIEIIDGFLKQTLTPENLKWAVKSSYTYPKNSPNQICSFELLQKIPEWNEPQKWKEMGRREPKFISVIEEIIQPKGEITEEWKQIFEMFQKREKAKRNLSKTLEDLKSSYKNQNQNLKIS
jgi:hypothetical protein